MKYIVPTYYRHFVCKCGECRNTCCHGWPVTITKAEYERLKNAECGAELRGKLDRMLEPLRGGSSEAYARIAHDRFDNCPLLRSDGLCGLQLALGAEILPDVCRLYPRNMRSVCGTAECVCSDSCEGVIETLRKLKKPLETEELELDEAPKFEIDMKPKFFGECREALRLFESGDGLRQRFETLGGFFGLKPCGAEEGSREAMRLMHAMTDHFAHSSPVAGQLCGTALLSFGMEDRESLTDFEADELAFRYGVLRAALLKSIPDWENWLLRLLENHMLYNSFPHVGGTNGEEDPFISLCVTTAFVDFCFCGACAERQGEEEAVGSLSTLFRLIEHSDFKYRAVSYYNRYCLGVKGCWGRLTTMPGAAGA